MNRIPQPNAQCAGPRRPLARRQILRAAAWSTPVIAASIAAPVATASQTVTARAVVNVYPPNVASYGPGQIDLNSAQIWYDPGAFAPHTADKVPATASASWEVTASRTGSSGNVILVPAQTVTLTQWGRADRMVQIGDLPAGDYVVTSRVLSVSFAPASVDGTTFRAEPSSSQSAITVS